MAEYVQWRNKNAYRSFPIADDASWTTTDDLVIPPDIFIDAMITPIDIEGVVWVSIIDFTESKVVLSTDDGELATAEIRQGETLEFFDEYGRQLGIMVPADSFFNLAGSLEFENLAMPLAPAAVSPQLQGGLRGFIMPDGAIVSGDVIFEGVNGITIVSDVGVDGEETLRFDALYTGNPEPPCVELPPPIKCIEVSQTGSGGVFDVLVAGNQVLLDAPYELNDLCQVKKDRVIPDEEGALPNRTPLEELCDPLEDPPCTPPEPVPAVQICENEMFINPVSSLFGMQSLEEPGVPAIADSISLPERPQQGLKLFIRGLQ